MSIRKSGGFQLNTILTQHRVVVRRSSEKVKISNIQQYKSRRTINQLPLNNLFDKRKQFSLIYFHIALIIVVQRKTHHYRNGWASSSNSINNINIFCGILKKKGQFYGSDQGLKCDLLNFPLTTFLSLLFSNIFFSTYIMKPFIRTKT